MRSIGKLFTAFGTLADSVLSLSAVVETVTAKLRMQLASETGPPALPHGEVLDNATASNGNGTMKRGKNRVGV